MINIKTHHGDTEAQRITEKFVKLKRLLQKSEKLSFRHALSRNPDSNCPKKLDPRYKHSGKTIFLQEALKKWFKFKTNDDFHVFRFSPCRSVSVVKNCHGGNND